MHVASATQQLMVGQVRDINDITIKIDKKLAPNNSAAAGVIPPRKKKRKKLVRYHQTSTNVHGGLNSK